MVSTNMDFWKDIKSMGTYYKNQPKAKAQPKTSKYQAPSLMQKFANEFTYSA